MGLWVWIFTIACIVLFVVPPLFVWHQVYQDGLFGRLGLLGISFFAFLVLGETVGGESYGTSPEVALLVASFALFLVWHLFRFHSRVLKIRRADPANTKHCRYKLLP